MYFSINILYEYEKYWYGNTVVFELGAEHLNMMPQNSYA
jgi:hypothetical protein